MRTYYGRGTTKPCFQYIHGLGIIFISEGQPFDCFARLTFQLTAQVTEFFHRCNLLRVDRSREGIRERLILKNITGKRR